MLSAKTAISGWANARRLYCGRDVGEVVWAFMVVGALLGCLG
jgi:hypothetical protein